MNNNNIIVIKKDKVLIALPGNIKSIIKAMELSIEISNSIYADFLHNCVKLINRIREELSCHPEKNDRAILEYDADVLEFEHMLFVLRLKYEPNDFETKAGILTRFWENKHYKEKRITIILEAYLISNYLSDLEDKEPIVYENELKTLQINQIIPGTIDYRDLKSKSMLEILKRMTQLAYIQDPLALEKIKRFKIDRWYMEGIEVYYQLINEK